FFALALLPRFFIYVQNQPLFLPNVSYPTLITYFRMYDYLTKNELVRLTAKFFPSNDRVLKLCSLVDHEPTSSPSLNQNKSASYPVVGSKVREHGQSLKIHRYYLYHLE